MYDFGDKGIQDFGHLHKKVIPPSKKLVKPSKNGSRLRKLDPNLDVRGYDIPRNDIEGIKLKSGEMIRVGSDNPKKNNVYFKKHIVPVINKSFTNKELRDLNTYIEYPTKRIKKHYGGLATSYTSNNGGKKTTIIEISKDDMKSPATVIHEMLHAVRFNKNKASYSIHRDEAETALGTIIRLPKNERKKYAVNDTYYSLLKHKKSDKLANEKMNEDVKFIEEKCNCSDKNKLMLCIHKNLNKTHIGKLRISKKYNPNK